MTPILVAIQGATEERTVAMLSAFQSAPDDEDIAVSSGAAYGDGTKFAAVVITITGKKYPFTASEARYAADIAGHLAVQFPDIINIGAFRRLAAAMRDAADLAERDVHGFDS